MKLLLVLLMQCVVLFTLKLVAGQTNNETESYEPIKTDTTSINCNSKIPKINPKIRELTLNCVPNISYSQLLISIGITSLDSLNLNLDPTEARLNSKMFESLNVTKLVIDYKFENKTGKEELIRMHSDVLYALNVVEELEIRGVMVVGSQIEGDGDGVLRCARLRSLRVAVSDLRQVPAGWLGPCGRLLRLRLAQLRQRNGTKETRRKILQKAKSLRQLEIVNCFIEELEDELEGLDNLESLNVAHNQIHYALTSIVLPKLMELDLSHNHIFSSALLSSGVEKQPRLRALSLDYNTVLDICDNLPYRTTAYKPHDVAIPTWHDPLNRRPLVLHSIQRFSLRGTITTEMCFSHLSMDKLEYFDLSDSKISAFDFRALPRSKARRLEVNVSGCPIHGEQGLPFHEQDYRQLHHEELRVTGLNVTLSCDCDEYLWLSRAARERRVVLSGVLCKSGQYDLTTIPLEQLQCNKYRCGVCTCRKYWQDNATDVECGGELASIPREPGLRRLLAAGNLIKTIPADLPDSLIYLDLRSNLISRVSPAASRALFAPPERRVLLFENPIICDCENRPFILALMDHFDRVLDYAELSCIDDSRLIRSVDPDELCFASSRRLHTALASTGLALLGLVALVVGLYYRFGKAVKVFLYSKGLCLFCIREEELDADKEYDAFVSFSHNDEHFVTHDLLPGLEAAPYNYKLCVHYRNWIAGDLIPIQINQSVANSKRTIIVLSKSFLKSFWGILEFRTAHLSALKEGRTRLIIIIVDDILETGNLDGELRSYLRTNTYVKWGDPWFWDKVRYALPHRSIEVNSVEIKVDPPDDTEETIQDDTADPDTEEIEVNTDESTKEQKVKENKKEIEEEMPKDSLQGDSIKVQEGQFDGELTKDKDKQLYGTTQSDAVKEMAKYLNEDLSPVILQVSKDSAIEMENYK